jgi:dihydrofolate reductase
MASLIYSAITSLDGYIEDARGKFDWAEPDQQLHEFVNEQERQLATYLYGRRMYDVMVAWETIDSVGQPTYIGDYAKIWRSADKIVFSTTLEKPSSARTSIERSFDPETIRRLKAASARPISVGGPGLAAQAIKAGLVDEYHQFLTPVVVGGGKHWLPGGVFLQLDLMNEHRFKNGAVHLHYRTR